jgi:23S rRNA (uracil1939-C5)-methyltransferase
MKLRLDKAVYGGAGLARVQEGPLAGKAVFVPLTLPGELVEAHIVEDKRGFANAELDSVLEAATARTTPLCPYFGGCGGCQYQHAVYAQQVEMKASILRETLNRAHLGELPPIATIHANEWRYRNRIRLVVRKNPFALGYRERRSHTTLVVEQCPISAPLLERALQATAALGAGWRLGELCEEVEFFTNSAEDELLVSLYRSVPGSATITALEQFAQALRAEVPQLRGAGLFSVGAGKQPNRLLRHWGDLFLHSLAAGFRFRVSLGSFFQVNRFLIDTLVDLATSGRTGALAWDLYAGVGLFARALAANFGQVVAVEAAPFSSADLKINLGGASHKIVVSSTLEFLRQRSRGKSVVVPDLVVVDPPRAGLGNEVTSLLAKIGPPRIVYVSCDPATLSRDLQALLQYGYHPQNITLVDIFPQTFHLESVTVLERR